MVYKGIEVDGEIFLIHTSSSDGKKRVGLPVFINGRKVIIWGSPFSTEQQALNDAVDKRAQQQVDAIIAEEAKKGAS